MFEGYLYFIFKNIFALAITAILFGRLGWWLRCKLCKCGATRDEVQAARDKADKLEAEVRAARSAVANAEAQLEKKGKGSPADSSEVIALRKELDAAKTEADSLRIQAQKARESADSASGKLAESNKKQQERVFAAENELSKAREEIARLRSTVDKPASASLSELQAELQQTRRSLATATASFGNAQRERDAARADLQRMQERLAKAGVAPRKTKIDPFEAIAQLPLTEEPKVEYPMPKIIRAAAPLGLVSSPAEPAPEAAEPTTAPTPAATPVVPEARTTSTVDPAAAAAKVKAFEDARAAKVEAQAEASNAAKATEDAASAEVSANADVEAKAAEAAKAEEEAKAAAEAKAAEEASAAEAAKAEVEAKAADDASSEVGVVASSSPRSESPDLLPGLALGDTGRTTPLPSGERIPEATAILGKRVAQDDLKIVEGIGPKIEGLFNAEGIATWRKLSETTVERMTEILKAAGDRYALANPGTWAQQAGLAADGLWAELKELQDRLDGGKLAE
ncbi:MAG: hypothetical protein KDK97_11595 [Verrucomicrobiales bacterium]|nr:hypothetical protein [Verrucomicrobiales bacterium]MCP5559905.1 hypothetical protein [Verrucomicrobiaceae bacterium]